VHIQPTTQVKNATLNVIMPESNGADSQASIKALLSIGEQQNKH